MLAAMEACAHAARDDASPCLRALTEAEHAFERSNPSVDPPWVDFDEGGLTGHLARSFRDLNRPREAEQFAVLSIQLCRPTHLRLVFSATPSWPAPTPSKATLRAHVRLVGKRLKMGRLRSKRTFDEVARLVEIVGVSRSQTTDEFLHDAREVLKSR
jgi:hypothetical protein